MLIAAALVSVRRRACVAAALLLAGLSGALAAAGEPANGSLRASLRDSAVKVKRAGGDHVRWRTVWQLDWPPVPAAAGYQVSFMTSEGKSRKTLRLARSSYRVEVAKGENQASAGRPTRETQLATIQSLLALKVHAQLGDTLVPITPNWVPVGSVF